MSDFADLGTVVLRFVGWTILPSNLTIKLIPPIHQYIFRRPPPPPNTPQYQQAFRYTYAFVILSYLIFNLIYAALTQAPNYYQLLGVPLDADEGQLKTAFRNFARRNHPDKVGQQGMELFMRVRTAYESLMNPVKRFAYDRFGSAAFHFKDCITEDEYLHAGLLHSSGFYIGTLFFLIFYGVLGQPDSGAIWRYLLFFYLLFSELVLYFQPFPSSAPLLHGATFPMKSGTMAFPLPITILRWVFPRWIPFQHVSFMHEVYVAMSMAIARVLPVVWPDKEKDDSGQELAPIVNKLVGLTQQADRTTMAMILNLLTSIQGVPNPSLPPGTTDGPFPNDESLERTRQCLESSFIDNVLYSHPMLYTLFGNAVEKYRRQSQISPASSTSTLDEPVRAKEEEVETLLLSLSMANGKPEEKSPPMVSPTATFVAERSATPEHRAQRAVSELSPSRRWPRTPPMSPSLSTPLPEPDEPVWIKLESA